MEGRRKNKKYSMQNKEGTERNKDKESMKDNL